MIGVAIFFYLEPAKFNVETAQCQPRMIQKPARVQGERYVTRVTWCSRVQGLRNEGTASTLDEVNDYNGKSYSNISDSI